MGFSDPVEVLVLRSGFCHCCKKTSELVLPTHDQVACIAGGLGRFKK